jgi:hypothetical protein
MVRGKTFCVKDFFTIFLRVAWISETSCKSLSINDLQAQGGARAQILDYQRLTQIDLGAKTEWSQKIDVIYY